MTDLVAWFQLLGVLAAMFAAFASWRSSIASRRTAAHTEETARRTAVAMGLARRPSLEVNVVSKDTDPMTFYAIIRNVGSHEAIGRDLRLECPNAKTPIVVEGLPMSVPPPHDDKIRHWRDNILFVRLDGFRPLTAAAQRDVEASTLLIGYVLDFSDAGDLVTWRQTGALEEKITVTQRPDGIPGPDRVSYVYGEVEETRSKPAIVENACTSVPRRRGLVRRAVGVAARRVAGPAARVWRWIW